MSVLVEIKYKSAIGKLQLTAGYVKLLTDTSIEEIHAGYTAQRLDKYDVYRFLEYCEQQGQEVLQFKSLKKKDFKQVIEVYNFTS